MKSIQNPTVCIKSFKSTTICFSMVDLLCKFLIPTEINLFYIFHNNNNKAVFPGCNFSFMARQCYARGKDEGINNTELNSVITIITHLEGVVYFYVFFALLFKFLSTSSESWDKGKVTPISKDIFLFWFLTATSLCFKFNVFVSYHLFMFFHCNKQNAFEKTNLIEQKKEDITLQNSAGGKYIYGPPNFIYARKKRCQIRYNAFLMNYNLYLII